MKREVSVHPLAVKCCNCFPLVLVIALAGQCVGQADVIQFLRGLGFYSHTEGSN